MFQHLIERIEKKAKPFMMVLSRKSQLQKMVRIPSGFTMITMILENLQNTV